MDAVADGFQNPDVFDGPPSHETYSREAIERVFADTFASPGFERIIALRNGVVAGGASLRLHQGVALLARRRHAPCAPPARRPDRPPDLPPARRRTERLRHRRRHHATRIEIHRKRHALRLLAAVRARNSGEARVLNLEVLHEGFFTRGSSRGVLHAGFFTRGSSRGVLHAGFCTRVLHERFRTRGSEPDVAGFEFHAQVKPLKRAPIQSPNVIQARSGPNRSLLISTSQCHSAAQAS